MPHQPIAAVTTARSPLSFELPVVGMSCASCVVHVERAVRAVAGVADVAVNLATERARVSGTAELQAAAVAAAIERAGYQVATEPVDLKIEGMSCASCVAHVERALMRVPGVLAA